jgi:hypothetical protein
MRPLVIPDPAPARRWCQCLHTLTILSSTNQAIPNYIARKLSGVRIDFWGMKHLWRRDRHYVATPNMEVWQRLRQVLGKYVTVRSAGGVSEPPLLRLNSPNDHFRLHRTKRL